ncbi:MAG: cytochrome P460 family protein [Taibaiella sp.]|jgi:hypothetical protein
MNHRKKILVLLSILFITFSGFDIVTDKEDRLHEIASEYKSYRPYTQEHIVVTDSSKFSWTIGLCEVPPAGDSLYGFHFQVDSSFMSMANEALSPHGNKLYKLYIKDYRSYLGFKTVQPVGQVIVKETWNVKEVVYDSLNRDILQIRSRNDGKWYTPLTVSEVFIMYKEKENKSNDKGWNYGNVSIEDKTRKPILFNDRKLSSCIRCHVNTKYDRIFGVNRN